MRCQKGQGLLEFAFVLPFLILIIFGLFYTGMLFSDYIALNNIARVAARDASLVTAEDYQESQFNDIYDKYITESKKSSDPTKHFLPNSLYTWDPSNKAQFSIEPGDNNVVVTLNAPVNQNSGLYGSLSKVLDALQNIQVTYEMYSEYEHTASESSD